MTNASELQLQATLDEVNAQTHHRINELQQILSNPTTSIVQRSKAQVELSQLQKKRRASTRKSVAALTKGKNCGHVSKNKATIEREVKRNEERVKHEQEILQIQQELQSELSVISMEVRQTLEKRLSIAMEAIEVLDVEEAEEMVNEMYDGINQDATLSPVIDTSPYPEGETPGSLAEDEAKLSCTDFAPSLPDLIQDMNIGMDRTFSLADSNIDNSIHSIAEEGEAFLEGIEGNVDDTAEPQVSLSLDDSTDERIAMFNLAMKNEGIQPVSNMENDSAKVQDEAYSPDSIAALLDFEDKGGAPRQPELISNLALEIEGRDMTNEERIKALEGQVLKLLAEANEREAMLYDWKSKATKLSSACLSLAEDVQIRDKSIKDLKESNRLQEERIVTIQARQMMNPMGSFTNQSMGSSMRGMQGTGESTRSRRRFSTRASNVSLSASIKRVSMVGGTINEQLREEAKIEVLALEERIKEMDSEKADLLHELKAMKAILAETSDQKQGKKVERLVYQLSCKKCHKHMNFIGTTDNDLKTTMEKHFDNVVKAAKSGGKKSKSNKGGKVGIDGDTGAVAHKNEDWTSEFADHFARHCRPTFKFKSVSEEDIIKFCRENVKIEVLKRSDGSELFWEDHE